MGPIKQLEQMFQIKHNTVEHEAILYNEAEVFSLSIGTLRIYDGDGEDDA